MTDYRFNDMAQLCRTGGLLPYGMEISNFCKEEEECLFGSIDAPEWLPAGGCERVYFIGEDGIGIVTRRECAE